MVWKWCRWEHSYELIGRHGGLHFHVLEHGAEMLKQGCDPFGAGLEVHYRQPPDGMAGLPPSHDECWLLKCPCWHDGTSLYAQETLLPMWEQLRGIPESVFRFLAHDADSRFAEFEKGNEP
jgi:hypothetical protein